MIGFSERLLRDAGIQQGMRVIDIGCGRGDVSLLLAEIVGTSGEVVGVDRDATVLELARSRVADRAPIRFVQGDFSTPAREGSFDAAIGRRVLMYQADPVDAVQRLRAAVRPGGLIVFQEHQSARLPTDSFPLHAQLQQWTWQTVAREGGHLDMGLQLATVLERAGLIVEDVRAEAVVQTRDTHSAFHSSLGPIVHAIANRITSEGVATATELDLDTLDARLLEERRRVSGTFISDLAFGAFARVPTT